MKPHRWEAIPDGYGTWFVVKGSRAIAHDMTMLEAVELAIGLNQSEGNL